MIQTNERTTDKVQNHVLSLHCHWIECSLNFSSTISTFDSHRKMYCIRNRIILRILFLWWKLQFVDNRWGILNVKKISGDKYMTSAYFYSKTVLTLWKIWRKKIKPIMNVNLTYIFLRQAPYFCYTSFPGNQKFHTEWMPLRREGWI